MRAAALAAVLAGALASSAHAQAPACTAGARHDVPTTAGARYGAVALARSGAHALAVVAVSPGTVTAVPLALDGTPGTPVAVDLPGGGQWVDVLAVGDRFVVRTLGVCERQHAPHSFHKCLYLRTLDAGGRPVAEAQKRDVVEWTGGTAFVTGTQLHVVRTPMYDRGGTPTLVTFDVAADGTISEASETDLAGPMPDARAVVTTDGTHWTLSLASSVDGTHAVVRDGTAVPGAAQPPPAAATTIALRAHRLAVRVRLGARPEVAALEGLSPRDVASAATAALALDPAHALVAATLPRGATRTLAVAAVVCR